MILRLRRRHRSMFRALAVGLPLAWVFGIAGRQPVPVMGTLPALVFGESPTARPVLGDQVIFPGPSPIRLRWFPEESSESGLALTLLTHDPGMGPDRLVYWVSGPGTDAQTLPDSACLLGAFVPGAPLAIPVEMLGRNGRLILYSLAHAEVVASSQPFQIQPPEAATLPLSAPAR